MNWLLAIILALAALGIGILAFRVPKAAWTSMATALTLGLAGYALQAQPGLPGAPAVPASDAPEAEADLIAMRRLLSGSTNRQPGNNMILADAMARQGQYANAATILGGATEEQPDNAEVWLALGNALVEQAEGRLTQPALFAYRRADRADPDGLGVGFFVGLGHIRQGRFAEAAQLWRDTLDEAAPDAPGRDAMAMQADRLEQLLATGMPPVPSERE